MSKEIACNKCGKKFDIWDSQEEFSLHKKKLGYGTKYDRETLSIDLCCKCMDKFIDECVISPLSNDT